MSGIWNARALDGTQGYCGFGCWMFLLRMRYQMQHKGVFGGTCFSQGVSAKPHVFKCLPGVKHLGKTPQNSQQTFCNASPDLFYYWEFFSFCKSQTCCKGILFMQKMQDATLPPHVVRVQCSGITAVPVSLQIYPVTLKLRLLLPYPRAIHYWSRVVKCIVI